MILHKQRIYYHGDHEPARDYIPKCKFSWYLDGIFWTKDNWGIVFS